MTLIHDVARAAGRWIEAVRVPGGGAIDLRDGEALVGRLWWPGPSPHMTTVPGDIVLESVEGRWNAHDLYHQRRRRYYTPHHVRITDQSGRGRDATVESRDFWPVEGALLTLPGERRLEWREHEQTDEREPGILSTEKPGEATDGGRWTLEVPAPPTNLVGGGTPLVWAQLGGGRMGVAFAPQVATDPDRALLVLVAVYLVFMWWDAPGKARKNPPMTFNVPYPHPRP